MNQGTVIKTFSFSYFMTMAVVVSFFPVYYHSLGYSKLQIGSLYSIGPAVGILSNLIWGLLSDRFQTLKKTIIAVLVGQLVMVLLLFQTDVYSILYVIMMFFYFFQTPLNGLNDSQILLHVRQTGKSYAAFRVWGSIGFATAAVLVGTVLTKLGVGFIAVLTISSVAVSLCLAFLLKDSRQGMTRMDLTGVWHIIFSRKFLWFLALILIMSISHRVNDGFLALYMTDLGASTTWVGYAWMTSALSEIPVFFYLSKHGHRYKELPLLGVACGVYALRFLLMSFVSEPGWIVATQLLHSLSFGIFLFTALRYLQQLVPDQFRATGQAVYNMTWSGCAGLISGFVGGRMYDIWGGVVLYRFAAITAAVACIGFIWTHLWTDKPGAGSSIKNLLKGKGVTP